MKSPVFIFAVSLLLTLRVFCGAGLFLSLIFGFLFLLASGFRAFVLKKTRYSKTALAIGFAISLGCLLTIVSGFGSADRLSAFINRAALVEGVVTGLPEETDYGYQYEVEFHSITRGDLSYVRRVRGILYLDSSGLSALDRFAGTAVLRPLKSAFGEQADFYRSGLAKGIAFRASAKTSELEVTGSLSGQRVLQSLSLQFVERAKETYTKILGDENGHILLGLVTGQKSGIMPGTMEIFRRVSLSHILSVSGMHLSYLAGLLLLLLRNRNKALRLLIVFAALIFYCFVAGFTPSVMRSALMTLLLLFSQAFGTEYDPHVSLGAAAIFIMVQNPFSVYDLGFLLSFSSVFGIITFSGRIHEALSRPLRGKSKIANKLLSPVVSSLALSLSVLLASSFVLLFNGLGVYLLSPVVNLLCVWAMPLLFLGGIALIFLGGVPVLGGALAGVLTALIQFTVSVAASFSKLSVFNIDKRVSSMVFWLIYIALMFGAYFLYKRKKGAPPKNGLRKILTAGVCTLVFVLVLRVAFPPKPGGLAVSFLDVGQGLCILIKTDGLNAVYDCGSTSSGVYADSVLEETLRSNNINGVELVVLSHFHADHADGMAGALIKSGAKSVIVPPGEGEKSRYETEILSAAEKLGTNVVYADTDLIVRLSGDVTLYIFSGHIMEGSAENEQNIVALITCGDSEFLFMGDLDRQSERRFAAYFEEVSDYCDIDVLQVGHHGSKYASGEDLLALTTPEIAVISVGKGNTYGHPAKEAVGRLERIGAQVFTTMESGTVTLFTGGDGRYELKYAKGD